MTRSLFKSVQGRRRTLVILASTALVGVPVGVAGAVGSWSADGGDSGHSGYQAVAKGRLPLNFVLRANENPVSAMRTGATITAADTPENQRVAYGKYFTGTASQLDRTDVVIRALDDPTSPLQAITDVDQSVDEVGDDVDADADGFGPAPGGVNPISSSSGVTPGVLFVVHNDDDQPTEGAEDDFGANPTTASENDISLAYFNESTGAMLNDFAIGKPLAGPLFPNDQATDDYTIEASPVLGPPATDGSGNRSLLFVAKGGGTKVPRLFKVPIDAAGSPGTIDTRTDDVAFVEIAGMNTKVPPTIAYLEDPSHTAGTEIPYVIVSVTAGAGASDLRALKIADFDAGPSVAADIAGNVQAVSIPVSDKGLPPGQPGSLAVKAPSVYAAYQDGSSTVVRRFRQNGNGVQLDETAASPPLNGAPAPGLAVAVEVVSGVQQAGRIVVATSANIFILDSLTLQVLDKFQDDGETEFVSPRGFTKTAPTVSGDLIYVARDDGAQLVLNLSNGETVANDPTGFVENVSNNTSQSSISRPAVANGYVAFVSNLGMWLYRGALNPLVEIQAPAPGAQVSGMTVPFSAKVTDPDGTVAEVRFIVDNGNPLAIKTAPDTPPSTYSTTFNSLSVQEGAHTLLVSAKDNLNTTGVDLRTFIVNNFLDPTASLKVTPSEPRDTDTLITLDASGSAPTPSETGETLIGYKFDLDQNGSFELDNGGNATAEVKFATPGKRLVKVQVTDSHGDTAVASVTVESLNRPPVPAFTGPALVKPGATATFDASASGDPDGSITLYEWDLDGDGNFETNTGTTPTASKQFPNSGTVKVQLRVTDDSNKSSTIAKDIVVGNVNPTALFVAIPTAANTDERVSFDASGSKDSDGAIVKYEWDLDGNGTFEVNGGNNPRTSRVYTAAGVVNVKLRVTDSDGASAEVVRQITIIQRPIPPVSPRSLSLTVSPKTDKVAPFAFTAKGTLGLPAIVTRALGCSGTVTVTTKAGNRTISTRRAKLSKTCRYSTKISFKDGKKFGKAKVLRVQARFGGNTRLKSRRSGAKNARVK